jgi:hypothetical protein
LETLNRKIFALIQCWGSVGGSALVQFLGRYNGDKD